MVMMITGKGHELSFPLSKDDEMERNNRLFFPLGRERIIPVADSRNAALDDAVDDDKKNDARPNNVFENNRERDRNQCVKDGDDRVPPSSTEC